MLFRNLKTKMVWEVENPDTIKNLLANPDYEQLQASDEKKEPKSRKKTEVV